MSFNLEKAGWNSFFMDQYGPLSGSGLVPGRVLASAGSMYRVLTSGAEAGCPVSGHFGYTALSGSDYPAVGDWVLLRETAGIFVIEKVLERKSRFSRRVAGRKSDEQVIAANIDIMFITASLDGGRNFNLRGIERYLVMVYDGGAEPVLVLNKADLCDDRDRFIFLAASVSGDVPVLLVSALTGEGMDGILSFIPEGTTAAFTGPSGVGKSAIVNSLIGEKVQKTGMQRSDDLRGRHTTTSGGLFFTARGGMVIDTPGLRELKPYSDSMSAGLAFPEITAAARNCRFRDCTHTDEPGCAVKEMMVRGELEFERYQNFITISREMDALEGLKSEKGKLERKARDKALSKLLKQYNKEKRK